MTSSVRFEEAKKWIDSVGPRWRLQVLSKKFRIDPKTGERTDLPVRLRRFVEGVPWSLVHDSIDYLLSTAPYTGIIYNGVEIPGTYRPTITSWTRDDKDETVSKTSIKTNDGTYTLVQDLIEDRDNDFYGATTGGSCSEEVMTEWHWDSASIEDMPTPSQGVSYSIQAVTRNEDGTFDYALVRRTSKTQHMDEHVQSDGPFEKVTVETWDNVYGVTGEFIWDYSVSTLASPVPVPIPDSGTVGGVQTVVRVSENQDCTYKIEIVRTTTKPDVSQARSTEKDQYAAKETDVVKGASSALPDAPAASGGDTFRHESQLQPDGTYTTSKTKETELQVDDAVVEISVGRKGRKETVTSRNVSSPASTSVAVGGSVRNEKTPGGRFNTVVSSWVNSVKSLVGVVCKIDLFSHRHTVEKAGAGSLDDVDVTGSGTGGVVITKSTRMDDDGAVIESIETETEKPVTGARESWTVGLSGLRHRVESRNVTSPEKAPESGIKNIGKTVVNERTPGGLYNTTTDELDRSTPELKIGSDCSKTVFEHVDSETKRGPDVKVDGHVEDAGRGKHYTRTSSVNEDGSVTSKEVTTTEITVPEAEKTVQKTRRAVVTTTVTKSGTEVASVPSNIGSVRKHVRTPGGRYDLTVTDASVVTGQKDSGYYRGGALTKAHDQVEMSVGSTVEVHDEGYQKNKIKTVSADVDEYGIIKTVTRVEEEATGIEVATSREKMARGTVETVTKRETVMDGRVPENIGESIANRLTDAGNSDVTRRTVTASSTPDSAAARATALTKVNDEVTLSVVDEVIGYEEGFVSDGSGYTISKSKELDQYGIQKEVVRKEYERTGVELSKSIEKVRRGVVTTTTTRRSHPDANTPNNIGEMTSSKITEAGNHDVTKRTVSAQGTIDTGRAYGDYLVQSYDSVSCDAKSTVTVSPVGIQGQGSAKLVTEDVDDYGIARKIERVETPSPVRESFSSCELDASKVAVVAFANANPGNVDTYITRVSNFIKATSKQVNGSVVYPTGQSVSISVSINKFGLLDGHVTGHLSYPSTILSQNSETMDFTFTILNKSISPVYFTEEIEGTSSSTYVTRYKKVIITYEVDCRVASGVGYSSLLETFGEYVGSGSSVHYNFSDGSWSVVRMASPREMSYKVTVEDGGTIQWGT